MPEKTYREEWGARNRPHVERCWEIEKSAIDRTLDLVEALGRWQRTNLWRSFAGTFQEAMTRVGIRLVNWTGYQSMLRSIRRFGRVRVHKVGVWAIHYICQVPLRGGLKARAMRRVEEWVEESGRTPSMTKARELVREIAPEVVKSTPRAKEISRLRAEFREKHREDAETIRQLRKQLRDCWNDRARLAKLVKKLQGQLARKEKK